MQQIHASVSVAGTITSFVISDGGSGYTSAPAVSIGVTAGIGTIFAGIGITVNTNATAVAGLSGVGTVNSLTVTNAGAGYTNTTPPVVATEPESSVMINSQVLNMKVILELSVVLAQPLLLVLQPQD